MQLGSVLMVIARQFLIESEINNFLFFEKKNYKKTEIEKQWASITIIFRFTIYFNKKYHKKIQKNDKNYAKIQ